MTPEEIKTTYVANLGLYEALKEELLFEVKAALNNGGIKYHSVTARVKELDSFQKKAEDKECQTPFETFADLVGARVVTLFLSDIQKIVKILQDCFEVHFVDDKIDATDPRIFGYLSVHLHARIKQTNSGLRYDKIKPFQFEIQIRTIAMDAWASASHYLSYKSEEDVPPDLRRDFNALSGLYYVADKHFELFFRAREANIKKIDRSFRSHQGPREGPLDLDVLTAFLKDRYPDRRQSGGPAVASLLAELRQIGINDLETLRTKLDASQDFFAALEKQNPPSTPKGKWIEESHKGRYAAVGVVRVSLGTASSVGLGSRKSTPKSNDW